VGKGSRRTWQENDLGICRFGHSLHCLQVPDLHGWSRGKDIGGLAHEFGGLDLGACGDDFALSDPLGLGGHGEGVLEFVAEDDVLDQHALDLHTPARGDVLDYLADRLRNLFPALNHVLENARADDVAEGGLGTLDEGLADIGDTEGSFVRGGDVVVDDGSEVKGDIVFCHADLFGNLCDHKYDQHMNLEKCMVSSSENGRREAGWQM